MHKMWVKAKMEARDEDMKKRAKELEIGKGARYAMPFRGVIGAMEAVPYQEGGEEKRR